jgi:hypothetical protein
MQSLRLDDLLYNALVRHRCAFVQLFVDQGVELVGFLTTTRLLELYSAAMTAPSNSTMSQAYEQCIKLRVGTGN